jgi:hypothetical protein
MAKKQSQKTFAEIAEDELTSGDYDDFSSFAANHLFIQTKKGDLVPFELNKSQRLRQKMLDEMDEANIPIRVWEAKARQAGCSTHIQGWMFHRCITKRDEVALIAAHADHSVHSIFTKAKMFLDNLPVKLQPLTKYNNRAELDFRAPTGASGLRSRLSVMTAKSAEDARGTTARLAHFSEVAFYKQPERYFLATLQSMPDEPGTFAYAESTCNGSGDFHHTMYLSAKVWQEELYPWMCLKKKYPGNPDSDWYAYFTPWFIVDEYKKPLNCSEEEFVASLDGAEKELLEKFGEWVTLENLSWRRSTISSKCGGSIGRFHQEYPSTDEEAFSSSGSPVFDRDAVQMQKEVHGCWCPLCLPYAGAERPGKNVCPPHKWYEIRDKSDYPLGRERLYSTYHPAVDEVMEGNGRLSVWREPVSGARYIVSADVSKGTNSRDWDHLCVFDLATLEQVAEWRGKVELDELSPLCLLVALHYNNAILAPEVTGLGAGLIALLERSRYWNLYRRITTDTLGGPGVHLGWDTNRKTKPAMVGLMQKALKEGYVKIRSRQVLDEMEAYTRTILYSKDGIDSLQARMSAPPGKNDDACVSAMIANAVAHYTPGGMMKINATEVDMDKAMDHNQWSDDDWSTYEQSQSAARRMLSGKRRQ